MKSPIFAAAFAGLFSISAFAQAYSPVPASSRARVETHQAAAPTAKHHHKKHYGQRQHGPETASRDGAHAVSPDHEQHSRGRKHHAGGRHDRG